MQLIVYGSLKRHCFNFCRFGPDTQIFIRDLFIPNYQLFDLGPFPAAAKHYGGGYGIWAELHQVNAETFTQIFLMEIDSGYRLEEVFNNDGTHLGLMFTMSHLLDQLLDKKHKINPIINGMWNRDVDTVV